MRQFMAFSKKEYQEQLRTFKWLIIFSVLFLFGMLSPVLAKMMPDIISSMKVEGMQIVMTDSTAMDAYSQFFKNMTQMGIVVLLLVFGGTISGELTKGTLIIILAKGLPRHTVILSKYFASVMLWTVSYLLASLTTYGYTVYLFEDGFAENLLFSFFCLWLFGCFVIALIFLSSTIAPGSFGGLVLSAGALVILLMVNIFPQAKKFNPVTLASDNVALLKQTAEVSELIVTAAITGALIIAGIVISIFLFRRKKV